MHSKYAQKASQGEYSNSNYINSSLDCIEKFIKEYKFNNKAQILYVYQFEIDLIHAERRHQNSFVRRYGFDIVRYIRKDFDDFSEMTYYTIVKIERKNGSYIFENVIDTLPYDKW